MVVLFTFKHEVDPFENEDTRVGTIFSHFN